MSEGRLAIPSTERLLEGRKRKAGFIPGNGSSFQPLAGISGAQCCENMAFYSHGAQAGKDQNPFENSETHPGALWFGNCRVNLKTAVCHYFHCTFSRVSTWRATSEQILLCWGMGAEARRGRLWESSLLATGSPACPAHKKNCY